MNRKTLLLLLIILLFTNCKKKNREFIVAFSAKTYIMDPHRTNWATDMSILDNVFESLVKKRFDFRIEPSLAYRWYNPKPKIWIFDIEKNIFFHNNKELTSYMIVKNFERLKNLGIYSPYIFITNSIEKVSPIGKYKVKFFLKKRISNFLILISDIKIMDVSNIINRKETTIDALIGTGPFKISKISKDSVSLKRFNRYWQNKGKLTNIKFIFGFNKEELRYYSIKPDIITEMINIDEKDIKNKYLIIRKPSNFVYFLLLNPKLKPLSDINVRKYIASIINKQKIVNSLKIPTDYINNVFVPPWLKHYYIAKKSSFYGKLPSSLKNNREKIIIVYPNNDFINAHIAKYIYNLLKRKRIKNLELKSVSNKKWRYLLFDDGFFHISPFRYATDTGGVDDLLIRFFHTRTDVHGVLNIFDYSNKELDKLIDIGLKERDPNLRYKDFVKAHKTAVEQKIFIPLFIKPDIFLIKKGLDLDNFTDIGNLNSIK